MNVGAVVVGGDYRGLGLVRGLGRRGVPVYVIHHGDTLATHSRYCTRAFRAPARLSDLTEFLLTLARRHRCTGWVLLPTADDTAWEISANAASLGSRFRLTTSPLDLYRQATDKRLMAGIAKSVGVATPLVWLPADGIEVTELGVTFPAIVKPSVRVVSNELTRTKAWQVDDPQSLVAAYQRARSLMPADQLLIQELVPGGGEAQLSFAAACRAGDPVVSISAVRLRQHPVRFGRASTFVRTIKQPDLCDAARRMLAALPLDGLVELEFKRDARDGALKLLDLNARIWGWHSAGEAAGIDLPYAAYLIALGQAVERVHARADVRWSRTTTDLLAISQLWRSRELRIGEYLSSIRPPLHGPITARDDRWPAVVDPLLMVRRAASAAMPRRCT